MAEYIATRVLCDAHQMTDASIADEASWPAWVKNLKANGKLVPTVDPQNANVRFMLTKARKTAPVLVNDFIVRNRNRLFYVQNPDSFLLAYKLK